MRILQVRFSNLNSLAGEWQIDLTDPAYTAEGIFAITGPTGAGKSTILDAICLALYGRTPRLSRISKNSNEIMSRHTGDCFAEVTFQSVAGQFRCHWSQRRAHRRASGELQNPKHEIANAFSGEVLESSLRGVAEQVEIATGMDFDRFTRSMLLAQGGFAAFLQAAPDERAPLLEQITGTEIYSRISMRVHERRSLERSRLAQLQAALDGLQPMTTEQEAEKLTLITQYREQGKNLGLRLEASQAAVNWHRGMQQLEQDLLMLQQGRTALDQRMAEFAPQQEKLELAKRALELSAEHAGLHEGRQEQAANMAQLEQSRQLLPEYQQQVTAAGQAMESCSAQRDIAREQLQRTQPVLRRVRELDLQSGSKAAVLANLAQELAGNQQILQGLVDKREADSRQLLQQRKELENLTDFLAVNAADGQLVEQFTGLQARIDALGRTGHQLQQKQAETRESRQQLQAADALYHESLARLESGRQALENAGNAVKQGQAKLTAILDGNTAGEWRRQQTSLLERQGQLRLALQAARSMDDSLGMISQLQGRQLALEKTAVEVSDGIAALQVRLSDQEKQSELLETQLVLVRRIQDLESERSRLEDHKPCPLCGATEHPFAEGNIPDSDQTQQQLAGLRDDLRMTRNDLAELRMRETGIHKDLQQAKTACAEHQAHVDKARRVIAEHTAGPETGGTLDAACPDLLQTLQKELGASDRQLQQLNSRLEQIEVMETAVSKLLDSQASARETLALAERESQSASHGRTFAEQQLTRLAGELKALEQQRDAALQQLREQLAAFGWPQLVLDELDTVGQQLLARRNAWQDASRRHEALQQAIVALETRMGHVAEQADKLSADISRLQDQQRTVLQEQQALNEERYALLGERPADSEEEKLNAALDAAEKALDAARQSHARWAQQLARLESRCAELEQTTGSRGETLCMREQAFRQRLQQAGFHDESHYQAACLPEPQRQTLAQQAQQLADENTELASRQQDKQQQLTREQGRALSQLPLEALQEELSQLQHDQSALHQALGKVSKELEDNARLQEQQRERLLQMEKQQRECVRWDQLHELIGSADGKKFRNFAQGLTFELMVAHANRQLQKMSDRYLLIRDVAQPLELNVIDNYQAGEIRSTKNLSGGESFIVSLALALGLSHMASSNVRVDSLFLDEGFGTLDEEALEVALETLAGLQQEGKLIGVISHVAALKERISTRIQVSPQSGGRSRIAGPGCAGASG